MYSLEETMIWDVQYKASNQGIVLDATMCTKAHTARCRFLHKNVN